MNELGNNYCHIATLKHTTWHIVNWCTSHANLFVFVAFQQKETIKWLHEQLNICWYGNYQNHIYNCEKINTPHDVHE
jgi:hypothetical protein